MRGRGKMVEKIIDRFLKPGRYIKKWDEVERRFRYYLLTSAEGPLKYPYTFSSLAANTKGDTKNFEDLNPSKSHLYQVLLGIRDGYKLYIWLPYDKKVLKMDEATLDDIAEDSVALEYSDSPYEDPIFSFWISRDKYPGIQLKNTTPNAILPQIIFIICKYEYEEVTRTSNSELFTKLERNIVPAVPIFAGAIA